MADAFSTLELDARLDGGATSPGMQNIRDATESMVKERDAANAELAASSGQPPPRMTAVVPARGKMKKIPMLRDPRAPVDMGDEDEKILAILQDELVLMAAPVLNTIWSVSDP